MTTARTLVGRCLCSRMEYEVADTFEYAINCHCFQCRRTTGSAFKPLGGILASKLVLRRGEANALRVGDDSGHDLHRGACGSLLYSRVRESCYVHVAMSTPVDNPSIRPAIHIFVGSKAAWFEITDALPQYDGLPRRTKDNLPLMTFVDAAPREFWLANEPHGGCTPLAAISFSPERRPSAGSLRRLRSSTTPRANSRRGPSSRLRDSALTLRWPPIALARQPYEELNLSNDACTR